MPDVVYKPCGHGGICYDCAIDLMKKNNECYLCREVFLLLSILVDRRNIIVGYLV